MSSTFDLPSFSVTEVDDIMEVSSEHNHNAGDEDIDIDIDLTAGQADEDYILEDATSNAGFDDDLHPQPSPATGNDEPMIDDDNGDDLYQMHDEHLLTEETDGMDHETHNMSFNPPESTDVHFEEKQVLNNTNAANAPESRIENSEVPGESAERTATEADIHRQHTREAADSGKGDHPSDLVNETDARNVDSPQESSRSSTPNARDPTPIDHLTSPLATAHESLNRTPTDTISTDGAPHISEESENPVDVPSAEDPSNLPAHGVTVVYRNSDYALFSTSESDDPDSFFLSDLSITKKPLISFFDALRDVIHDDLAVDDDLCIVVEDLGLEIVEVSYSMTLLP